MHSDEKDEDEEHGTELALSDDAADQEEAAAMLFPVHPSSLAQAALQDYLNMGPARSIAGLRNTYIAAKASDSTAPIPTTNLYVLGQWEARYNWKALAWEHDADANRAYLEHRRKVLSELYTGSNRRADKLLRIAEKAIDMIEADIDAGNSSLSPQDALKFMQEGARATKEAHEALLRLQDPNENKAEQGGGDFFDTIRKMGLLQINQNNYYGDT